MIPVRCYPVEYGFGLRCTAGIFVGVSDGFCGIVWGMNTYMDVFVIVVGADVLLRILNCI